MGIAVGKLLQLEYFKDFNVLAGAGGLDKEIQGVAILDSPDGFRWGQGKELIISSGYVLQQDPDCVAVALENGPFRKASAFFLKIGRYLDSLPPGMTELFERFQIPLVQMPCDIPYMDMMNQINIAVMNQIMRHLQVRSNSLCRLSNLTHKEQKIRHILKVMETEMNFPSFLYDYSEEKAYSSSHNLQKALSRYYLTEKDILQTSRPSTSHVICDYTGMKRIRLLNEDGSEKNRISWVQVPILVHDTVQATLVVMESRDFLDYYDEYALRIAYVLLQAVYEQVAVARTSGQIGYENFIHSLLSWDGKRTELLEYQAGMQDARLSDRVFAAFFRQVEGETLLRENRDVLLQALSSLCPSEQAHLVFLNEKDGLLLFDGSFIPENPDDAGKYLRSFLQQFDSKLLQMFPGLCLQYSYSQTPSELLHLGATVKKEKQILRNGRVLCPDKKMVGDADLGILAWLQIPEDELEKNLKKYRVWARDDKYREHLHTLRIYLENSMNYSTTARILYVHINTVRKRVAEAITLLSVDLEDSLTRLRLLLLLQFLERENPE